MHYKGPALVLAGPGSGKTTVLVERVKNLILERNVSPDKILVVTFARSAAAQMQDRFLRSTEGRFASVTFSTIHSVCYSIINSEDSFVNYSLLPENEKTDFLRKTIQEYFLRFPEQTKVPGLLKDVLMELSAFKKGKNMRGGYKTKYCDRRLFEYCKNKLEEFKAFNKYFDFDDMAEMTDRLLSSNTELYGRSVRFEYVLVDEFQDSNPIQLKIFNKLSEIIAETDGHSYWVGDPKQAIYGFRGADTDLVNSVADHFTFYDDAEIHEEEGPRNLATGRLVESWRSRKRLVDLVNAVFYEPFKNDGINKLCIKLDAHFKKDDLSSNAIVHWECGDSIKNQQDAADALAFKVKELLDSKMQVHSGKRDEPATAISPRDVAILCRKNSACKEVVKALRKYGIPVSEAEDAIMQRIEVQLVVTLLQFMQDPKNKHVFANLMRLLWGNTTEEILRNRIDYVLEHIDSEGSTLETDKGYQQQTPWVGSANTNQKLMMQAASEFGLTPSARSRIMAASGVGKDEEDEMEHEYRRICQLLETIPDEQAEVIRLRFYGEKSFKEIADIIGVNLSTVKSRFMYGLEKIRRGMRASSVSDNNHQTIVMYEV